MAQKWLFKNLRSNFKPQGLFISKTLFAIVLTNFKRDNIKTFKESLMRISWSSLFHSIVVERKKRISDKVTPDIDIEYIIDLIASSRIKLYPVLN